LPLIDLHTHTTASDGSYSPGELLEAAAAIGLEALAITDHDTMAGWEEAAGLPGPFPFELIGGTEISAVLRVEGRRSRSLHLLAYFLRHPPPERFRQWLARNREHRQTRNREILERLHGMGIELSMAEVEARASRLIGRPHFAAALVGKGYAASYEDAFRRFVGESAPAYAPRIEPEAGEAIAEVRAAGGLVSLAHPGRIRPGGGTLEEIVEQLVERGLTALEVYHSEHDPARVPYFEQLAARFGLAATGGSDFHGAFKPAIHLGAGRNSSLCVPGALLERLRRL
jgi:3',5'-nucleoside bisphosphate phosphatase